MMKNIAEAQIDPTIPSTYGIGIPSTKVYPGVFASAVSAQALQNDTSRPTNKYSSLPTRDNLNSF